VRAILTFCEGVSLAALALPLLLFGFIGLLGNFTMTFFCWGVAGWGAVELLRMLFELRKNGRGVMGSIRRTAYGVAVAAVLVALIESPNTDRNHWVRSYWFLVALAPLIASLSYRVFVMRKASDIS
jgi:hypothetical protein